MSDNRRRNFITWAALLAILFTPLLTEAQVAWVRDFDSALKKAAKEEKFVILDFSASW
jgi:hypothetical protein